MIKKFILLLDKIKHLVLIILLFYFIEQSNAIEQCKLVNPVTEDVKLFDCTPDKPYCCESETADAHCCKLIK